MPKAPASPTRTSEYKAYLASREWAIKKEAVRKRSGDSCELCFYGPHNDTHHLTYERIYAEELDDLLAVCRACHEWLSGKSNHCPLSDWAVVSPSLAVPTQNGPVNCHLVLPFDVPEQISGDGNWICSFRTRCRGRTCPWCGLVDPHWMVFASGLRFVRDW